MTTETITTAAEANDIVSALDIRAEIIRNLSAGSESSVEVAKHDGTTLAYFPNAGRGAVADNGNAQWIDCTGLDDLADKWADAGSHDWNR